MSAELAQHLATLAADGFRLHVWPDVGKGFQANIAEPQENAWTTAYDPDPIRAILSAVRQRVSRCVYTDLQPAAAPLAEIAAAAPEESPIDTRQLDIVDAIAAASAPVVDEFAGL